MISTYSCSKLLLLPIKVMNHSRPCITVILLLHIARVAYCFIKVLRKQGSCDYPEQKWFNDLS